jgi:hypothetical protein
MTSSSSMIEVNVLEVRPVERGQLRAVARVRLAGCIAFECRILQQEGGDAWLGLPQAPIRKGGNGWTAAVAVTDPEVLAELREAVLAAWREAQP